VLVPVRGGTEAFAAWSDEDGNAELIAANRLIEILPSLVEAARRFYPASLSETDSATLAGAPGRAG
jgi:hypothetical protein